MAVNCEIKNGVGLMTITGSLNSTMAQSFRQQFVAWFQCQPGVKDVVLDLGSVGFMDSSGLAALIVSFKRVAERGGEMYLACVQPNVKMVLEITCTNRIFRLVGTVEEALRAASAKCSTSSLEQG